MQHTLEWLPSEGQPAQLLLLLHGWGGNGADMAPLAQALRAAFPQSAGLAPDAPLPHEAADGSPGTATARQWYAVAGLTPENWPQRVDAALPGLHDWVRAQQQRLGVSPEATALGGFSQGAVLALALAMRHDGLAGRVLAFCGCLTRVPAAAPRLTTLHLFHGADDEAIPAEGSRQALGHLAKLDGDATLDIAQGVGHVLHPALIDCALHRLRSHIPQRTWRAAMGAAAAAPDA
ncbi:esterase [Rubrivivax rivuli]|uniref:Esterase n=1 Tax=Rubrivivax rivuli TaxID=1862385 RepID=A0A437R8K0_9BURK|nr:esterase [Rubrivivax rivuli]RVU43055.1 esterase [Rubrivivax rivuli]